MGFKTKSYRLKTADGSLHTVMEKRIRIRLSKESFDTIHSILSSAGVEWNDYVTTALIRYTDSLLREHAEMQSANADATGDIDV